MWKRVESCKMFEGLAGFNEDGRSWSILKVVLGEGQGPEGSGLLEVLYCTDYQSNFPTLKDGKLHRTAYDKSSKMSPEEEYREVETSRDVETKIDGVHVKKRQEVGSLVRTTLISRKMDWRRLRR